MNALSQSYDGAASAQKVRQGYYDRSKSVARITVYTRLHVGHAIYKTMPALPSQIFYQYCEKFSEAPDIPCTRELEVI